MGTGPGAYAPASAPFSDHRARDWPLQMARRIRPQDSRTVVVRSDVQDLLPMPNQLFEVRRRARPPRHQCATDSGVTYSGRPTALVEAVDCAVPGTGDWSESSGAQNRIG